MSGTKRVYHLEEKNYFKFFGIQEKQDISVRSLTTHYKKIITILKQNEDFLSKDKVQFAHRAFETLVDPIARAKYILELNGVETDVRDSGNPEDFFYIHTFNDRYDNITCTRRHNDARERCRQILVVTRCRLILVLRRLCSRCDVPACATGTAPTMICDYRIYCRCAECRLHLRSTAGRVLL